VSFKPTKKSILLIGDTIVDKYVYLKPVGLSLETPTIKCTLESSRREFGGAANVAYHLSSLGCKVDFLTSIDDSLLQSLALSSKVNIIQVSKKTQLKERYYIVKNESYKYLQINDCEVIKVDKMPNIDFNSYDTIVVSDYRLGIADSVIDSLPKEKTICQMQISDSQASLKKYKNFHCIVGNEDEIPCKSIKEFCIDNSNAICISTQGEKGVVVYDGQTTQSNSSDILPKLKDYHGAGDAFLAGFCANYQFNTDSVASAVLHGIKTASFFLLRKENV